MHRRPSRIDGIGRWWSEEGLAAEGDIFKASVDHAVVERLEPLPRVIAAHVLGSAPSRDLDRLDEGEPRSRRPFDPSPALVRALDQVSELFQGRNAANQDLSPLANGTVGGEGVGGFPQGGNSPSVSGAEFPLGNTLGGVGGILPHGIPLYCPIVFPITRPRS
jgi:hypothetical protein